MKYFIFIRLFVLQTSGVARLFGAGVGNHSDRSLKEVMDCNTFTVIY
jgi:lipoprotein signal peptidase